MTTLTELLDLAYKMGHEDGWRQRDEFNKHAKTLRVEFSKERIIDICCKYYNMTFEQMIAKTRKVEVVIPRQVMVYLLSIHTSAGTVAIGRLINRDHTTAIHNREVIRALVQTDRSIAADVNYLVSAIHYELSGEPVEVEVKPVPTKKQKEKRGRKKGMKMKPKAPVVQIPIVRPPSHYSNRSPYGIASGLR